MRIFRIKDRLLEHWAPPFFAPSAKDAMAAIQPIINSGDKTNAFAQAPQQYELWEIGQIHDDEEAKKISNVQTYHCDLSSLVRGSLRDESTDRPTNETLVQQPNKSERHVNNSSQKSRTYQPATPIRPKSKDK